MAVNLSSSEVTVMFEAVGRHPSSIRRGWRRALMTKVVKVPVFDPQDAACAGEDRADRLRIHREDAVVVISSAGPLLFDELQSIVAGDREKRDALMVALPRAWVFSIPDRQHAGASV